MGGAAFSQFALQGPVTAPRVYNNNNFYYAKGIRFKIKDWQGRERTLTFTEGILTDISMYDTPPVTIEATTQRYNVYPDEVVEYYQ